MTQKNWRLHKEGTQLQGVRRQFWSALAVLTVAAITRKMTTTMCTGSKCSSTPGRNVFTYQEQIVLANRTAVPAP